MFSRMMYCSRSFDFNSEVEGDQGWVEILFGSSYI
jgi:hypothetical protein